MKTMVRLFVVGLALLLVVSVGAMMYALSGQPVAADSDSAASAELPEQGQESDSDDAAVFGYVIAPDASGINQVWALWLNAPARQVTYAGQDVLSYGVQPGGGAIAYNTRDALYFMADMEASMVQITTLTPPEDGMEPRANPNLNVDATMIAYTSDGLYVVDVNGGSPRLVVENVRDMQSIDDWRFMIEAWFVDDARLVALVGIWEASVPAVVDIATGTLTEAPRYEMSQVEMISADRAVLYTNSFRGITPGLQVASLESMAAPEELVGQALGVGLEEMAMIWDIVEYAPNQLRLIAEWLPLPSGDGAPIVPQRVVIDYDMETNSGALVDLGASAEVFGTLFNPQISPDGAYIFGLVAPEPGVWRSDDAVVIDVTTGEQVDLPALPSQMGDFGFE